MNTVEVKNGKILFDGRETYVLGRTSFKLMALLNQHFKGSPANDAPLHQAEKWIEWCQKLGFNLLRIFGETEDWLVNRHPMFGSYPQNHKVWDLNQLLRGERPRRLTRLNERMLEMLFKLSQSTGMAFEYVVDATLKHTKRNNGHIPAGTIGHCIRQTLTFMRTLQGGFPKAKIIVNFHNEWDAHNKAGLELGELNAQAGRARRWVRVDGNKKETAKSFTSPGAGFEPEQWPEAVIMVDHGGRDDIEYRCGSGTDDFMLAAIHPERASRDWWELPPTLNELRSFGQPVYFSESKMFVDPADRERAGQWYGGNRRSWTDDLTRYLQFIETAKNEDIHFCLHDEKGVGTYINWKKSPIESELDAGVEPPPVLPDLTPKPPPPSKDYEIISTLADSRGRKTFSIEFPDQPVLVTGVGEDLVYRKTVEVPLGAAYNIYQVDSFLGLDRGDVGEFSIEVDAHPGPSVYQRSFHKERGGNFESFWPLPCDADTTAVKIYLSGRVAADNELLPEEAIVEHRNGNRHTARPHFAVYLWVRPVGLVKEVPSPTPGPEPEEPAPTGPPPLDPTPATLPIEDDIPVDRHY